MPWTSNLKCLHQSGNERASSVARISFGGGGVSLHNIVVKKAKNGINWSDGSRIYDERRGGEEVKSTSLSRAILIIGKVILIPLDLRKGRRKCAD